ncbi:DUF2573 family protein [Caldalkalibacillus salinus]|uniref:DUF2573 family protein n=1 Tax=Caldalkalibacillus salinus TaxID=2803787 RepID=UPI00192514F7|nr:DUF2573 family protein [Caldalkalibacillus salinus]
MNDEFKDAFDAFVQKYAELLTGHHDEETIEKVKLFALYSHINKTMPALAKHWVSDNPAAKEEVKKIFADIQKMNQEHKSTP